MENREIIEEYRLNKTNKFVRRALFSLNNNVPEEKTVKEISHKIIKSIPWELYVNSHSYQEAVRQLEN